MTSKSTTKKSATLLDGAELAKNIELDLWQKISQAETKPGLAAILIGNDPASEIYIQLKEKASLRVGIDFYKYLANRDCCENISETELIELVQFLNRDPMIHAVLIQLPLPKEFDTKKILNALDPKKDVDGFLSTNKNVPPPTVAAIIELLKSTGENLSDKKTLTIVKSDVFVKNLETRLKEMGIKNVTREKFIPKNSTDYDIIVIALGQAGVLKKSMVKKGAVIIDVGINKVGDKTVGDVDPEVTNVAAYLSPVPGGVGPLTVACLLRNTYNLSKK